VGTVSTTITEPNALTINAIPSAITCFGESNGSIVASGNGGTSPYSYNLNGGAYGNTATFNNLSAATYVVGIQDANGCTQTFPTTVVEPTQVTITGISTASTGNNGTITVTGSGGNMPYTYSINGTNYYSGTLFTNLAPGTYTLYIKDVNGCIGTVQITVEETQGLENASHGLSVVLLYPNPNNGTFNVEVDGVVGEVVEGKLFSTDGKLVSEFRLGASNGTAKNTLEMSHKLAAGTYYLGLYNEERAAIVRFVKE
jgi:hypothetical protein